MTAELQLDKGEIDRLNAQSLSCLVSNRQEARRLTDIALAAARRLQYDRGAWMAELNHASLLYYGGQNEAAEQVVRPLVTRFHALGDLEGEMAALVCLGALASRRGDFNSSGQHFDNALQLAHQIPDSLYKFSLFNRMGIDALSRGDSRSGPRNFLLSLDMAERFGTAAHRVNALSNLASSQHDLGNDEDAIPLLSEALGILDNQHLPHLRPLVTANLAMCLLASGKAQDAQVLLEPFLEEGGLAEGAEHAFIQCLAAHALMRQNVQERALYFLQLAQSKAIQCNDYEEQMHAWLLYGMYHFARGEAELALDALGKAEELLSVQRNPFYQQQIYKGFADLYAQLQDWRQAYHYLQLYQMHYEARARSARDSRILMRNLEKEMRILKEERDRALELQAAREAENQKLETLNRELTHQIHHVSTVRDSLKEQAIRDHLTGLYNRRHFETCLNAILHESSGRFHVVVVILDLDFFKRVNDTYGHAFGDEVLMQFAQLVQREVRAGDMVCRYGGEEFCLLLRAIDAATAQHKIRQIAEKYRKQQIRLEQHMIEGCTFSAGIAEYPRHGATRHELLMRADTALYVAKMNGRDRAVIVSEGEN
ncbi:diguanylate cyclase [Massilia sp. W12]|uniref:diguanylate cyclase n=1 Tax=Massilia sp. W12 TaxID=3126507 RepID=UPI0030D054F8